MDKYKSIGLTLIFIASNIATAFSIIGMASILSRSEENYTSKAMIFFILTLIFGLVSFYIKRKKSDLKNNQIENIILEIATPHNGLITTAELAANCSLGLKESSVFLEACYSRGLCEKQYTEKSLIEVYYFRSAITLESKKTAKLITDIER